MKAALRIGAALAIVAGLIGLSVVVGAQPLVPPQTTPPPPGDPRLVSNDPPADQRKPTGGPFIGEVRVIETALGAARGNGATDATVTSVKLMTYGDSVRIYGHGKGTSLHPDREVYVAHIDGAVTTRKGPPGTGALTFEHTFWILDASTGDVVGWGNLP
jgi:hypothetical protein